MKYTRLPFRIICVILIMVSFFGVYEESAFHFLKNLAQKNTDFLAVVTEIKMIVAGLGSVQIPFVSGHTTGIDQSLEKAQNYLLLTDTITFLQIFFVAISKSLLFKLFLLTLFVLTFFEKTRRQFSKILILALALSPGISIYTVTVKHISQAVQMDFGEQYLKKLKVSTDKIAQENIELMRHHDQQMTKINNGQKGVKLFQKLKEDISYDLKKAKTNIAGDFSEIRTLIRSGGHSILEKVFRFCTMLLFCLLILPLGYLLLIRILIESLFKNTSLEVAIADLGKSQLQQSDNSSKSVPFFQKLGKIDKAIRKEFVTAEKEVEQSSSVQALHHKLEQTEQRINESFQNVVARIENKVREAVQQKEQQAEEVIKEEKRKSSAVVVKEVATEKSKLNVDLSKATGASKNKLKDAEKSIVKTESNVKTVVTEKESQDKEKMEGKVTAAEKGSKD